MYVVRRENCYNVMVRVSELLRNDGIETVSLKSRGLSPPTSRPFLFARSQEAGHQCSDLAFLYSPNNSLVPCNYPVKRSVGFPNPGLNYLNELPCLAPPLPSRPPPSSRPCHSPTFVHLVFIRSPTGLFRAIHRKAKNKQDCNS